jgi:hypothetical protein
VDFSERTSCRLEIHINQQHAPRRSASPGGGAKMMSKDLLTKTTVFMDYARNISRLRAEAFSTFTFEPRHGRLGL